MFFSLLYTCVVGGSSWSHVLTRQLSLLLSVKDSTLLSKLCGSMVAFSPWNFDGLSIVLRLLGHCPGWWGQSEYAQCICTLGLDQGRCGVMAKWQSTSGRMNGRVNDNQFCFVCLCVCVCVTVCVCMLVYTNVDPSRAQSGGIFS